MTRLYKKSPLAFALVWIAVYIVLLSVSEGLSKTVGVRNSVDTLMCIFLMGAAVVWMWKNRLLGFFGLRHMEGAASQYLWFLPLAALCSTNLWRGVCLNMSVTESILHVAMMIGVGFLEEIIFRGFLFRAMEKDGIKSAVIVSSLTFGIGHIVNLLQGADVVLTLLQICYAVAAGFLFTIIFIRSKSLWPCIITHITLNSLSGFANTAGRTYTESMISASFLCVVSVAYAWWIVKKVEKIR